MVAQPRAGDAGNARYAAALAGSLVATAGPGDAVAALVAHDGAADALPGTDALPVPAANLPRLGWAAARALAEWGAGAGVFTYVAPARSPCPLLLAVHDPSFLVHPEWLDRRARAVLRTMVPPSARRARLVLALSRTARADLVAALGLAPERVRVVSPPAAAAFTPRPGAPERVAARFGLRRYCLAVGDVSPRKNLARPGRRAGPARGPGPRAGPGGPARPPGGGHHRGQRRALAGRRSADDDLADLYRAAAVTCYPSRYEGFGLPVLEALACGAPVVASDRGRDPRGGRRRRAAGRAGARRDRRGPAGRPGAGDGGPPAGGGPAPGGALHGRRAWAPRPGTRSRRPGR